MGSSLCKMVFWQHFLIGAGAVMLCKVIYLCLSHCKLLIQHDIQNDSKDWVMLNLGLANVMDTWIMQCLNHRVYQHVNALEGGAIQIQKAVVNLTCCQSGQKASDLHYLCPRKPQTHTYAEAYTYRHSDPYSLIWIISSRHLDLRVSRLSEESVWWLRFIVPEGQDLQSSPSVLHRAPGQQLSEYTRLCVFIREER